MDHNKYFIDNANNTEKVKELELDSKKTLGEDTAIVMAIGNPIQQGSLIEKNQQVIPATNLTANNIRLGDNRVYLDQQPTSMKDSELYNLVMKELCETLTDKSSQTVGSSLLEIKSGFTKNEDQMNIKYFKNYLFKVNYTNQKEDINSEIDFDDALSTLATAALNQAHLTNRATDSTISKPIQPTLQVKQEGPVWYDVGIIKETTCSVKQFYSTSVTDEHANTSSENLPDYIQKLKINIEPGTAYKFRVAAINSYGRGEWSETSIFKTTSPGFQSPPTDIQITRTPYGASLTWKVPPTSSSNILEYTVCMAIKNPKENVLHLSPKLTTTNLNLFRVYTGPDNIAMISNVSLECALIDRTNKPAIILQIAAKNDKGYGPATQIKWLQDDN